MLRRTVCRMEPGLIRLTHRRRRVPCNSSSLTVSVEIALVGPFSQFKAVVVEKGQNLPMRTAFSQLLFDGWEQAEQPFRLAARCKAQ